MPTHGYLIAIEGIDGAGKTTQAGHLAQCLERQGFEVVLTKEPTNGRWGSMLRGSAETGRLPPEDELHAFTEDRKEHVADLIGPALARGAVVIVDRYYFSSAAYQGARGLPADQILKINEAFAPQPDLLVVLEVAPSVGLSRVRARGDEANLFEQEESLQQTAALFASFSRPYKVTIDGTPPPSTVLRMILDAFINGPVFSRECMKNNKSKCEPAYCSFRVSGECDFPSRSIEFVGDSSE